MLYVGVILSKAISSPACVVLSFVGDLAPVRQFNRDDRVSSPPIFLPIGGLFSVQLFNRRDRLLVPVTLRRRPRPVQMFNRNDRLLVPPILLPIGGLLVGSRSELPGSHTVLSSRYSRRRVLPPRGDQFVVSSVGLTGPHNLLESVTEVGQLRGKRRG
jgi:hypothetical protein